MDICSYSYEEYLNMVTAFHGNLAPGMLIGGFMVDIALKNLPDGELFDAIVETRSCLPDAVQLLTPCTIGNGWLKVIDLGRYALSFYEKYNGSGVRIFLDPVKIETRTEIKNWFLKLKPKKEQDFQLLLDQIKESGKDLCGIQNVRVKPDILEHKHKAGITICPGCSEAFPAKNGEICPACQGETPYI